ncbi:hypothetical protein [Paenibacillus faecalis]|uniref:hypothetical protein n=1 Tax=Paenibacillus faecalis TaxID=2079532 RepID=UPI00131A5D50|nr:hypothetical protein [Paenibacillus faecalis]
MRIAITVSSVNGSRSPYEWYAEKLKEFAKDKYGLEINVELIPNNTYKTNNEKINDTQ